MNKHIATLGVTIAIFRVFNKDARFYSLPLIILTNPCEF